MFVTFSCVLCIILLQTGGRKCFSFSLTHDSTPKCTGEEARPLVDILVKMSQKNVDK